MSRPSFKFRIVTYSRTDGWLVVADRLLRREARALLPKMERDYGGECFVERMDNRPGGPQ